MKMQRFIAAAFVTAALTAALALPAFAASNVDIVIQQIDEPLEPVQQPDGISSLTDGGAAEAEVPAPEVQNISPGKAEAEEAGNSEEAGLSAAQKEIILELIPDDLYRFYTSRLWDSVPETSLNIASLSSQDLVNELYGVLRNADRNSAIFTPVTHGAVEGYSVWFDKDDALSKIAGLYGRSVSESSISEYNADWGGDMPDMIAIDDNAIASLNAEGEGKVRPSIDSAVINGNDLTVSLSFTAAFDDAKDNGSGRATAVFTEAPESILGYRLKSISLN